MHIEMWAHADFEGYAKVAGLYDDDECDSYYSAGPSSAVAVCSPLHQQQVQEQGQQEKQQQQPSSSSSSSSASPSSSLPPASSTVSSLFSSLRSSMRSHCLLYLAFLSLLLAQLSLASVGPMFAWLISQGLAPTTAVSWRCQAMVLVQAPFALFEYYMLPPSRRSSALQNHYPDLPYSKATYVALSGFTWALQLLLWVPALTYMSTTLAAILCSTTPLMLAVYLRVTGTPLSKAEILGILVAFLGMAVAITPEEGGDGSDGDGEGKGKSWGDTIAGTMLCLGSAFAGLVNNLSSKRIKQHVPLLMYGFFNTVVLALTTLVWAMIVGGATCTSLDTTSVWGWLHPSWFGTIMSFAVGVALVTICGFNYAIQHVSLVIFATAGLFDPALTGIMSYCIGLEGVPGGYIWGGGAVTLLGGGLVIWGENRREKEKERRRGELLMEGERGRRGGGRDGKLKDIVVT